MGFSREVESRGVLPLPSTLPLVRYPFLTDCLCDWVFSVTLGFINFNIAGKWKRKYLGVAPDEGWFILTNLDTLESTIAILNNL